MKHPAWLTSMLVASSLLTITATAQTPDPPASGRPQPAANRGFAGPASQRRSIVHHYGYPYPGYYHSDQTAGFRNPGGSGRYLEYYPPSNQFQVNPRVDAVKVATFGGGGIPDRNEQLAAQSLGVAKYNAIQGHIDTMARPMWGVGFFGGF